ncbi:unnamed protein product [Prunus brigantina]
MNLSAPGAFWMVQIWLQVYFPELRFPDVVLAEDQVLELPLMMAEVPKRSIEEYLMFFKHCIKRSAAQWQVVLRRTYPWFQYGYRLFEKEPEEEQARTKFRKKFLSVTLPRDLPFGGGKPPNYLLRAEVYHPDFCARQLGCPQLIPLKSYRSCNRATYLRDSDNLEVHKDCWSILSCFEQFALELVEQAELPVVVPEPVVEVAVAVPELAKITRTAGTLAVVTSPLKPPIVAVSITFEAMDLDAQLDKLEKLSSTPGKAKSKAVDEAMKRVKIWQSTKLELDENREVVDQLMKDLNLLHR